MSEDLISFKGYSYKCFDCGIPLPEKSVKQFKIDDKVIDLCSKCYKERLPDLCPICNCFEVFEFDIPGFKGYCNTHAAKRWLTSTAKRTACDDYVPVIPEIEKVVVSLD